MHVLVLRANGSTSSFSGCVADVFTPDALTVTCTDAAHAAQFGPMQVFPPGTWREATVYHDSGEVAYGFQTVASRAARAELVTQHAARKRA